MGDVLPGTPGGAIRHTIKAEWSDERTITSSILHPWIFLTPPFPPTSCVLNVIGSQFTKNNKLFKRLNNPVRKRYWKVFRIIRSSLLSVETDKRRRQWTQSCLRTKKVKHLLNYSVRVSCVFPENRRFLCWVDVITLPGLAPRACCHLCSSVCVVVV